MPSLLLCGVMVDMLAVSSARQCSTGGLPVPHLLCGWWQQGTAAMGVQVLLFGVVASCDKLDSLLLGFLLLLVFSAQL